MLQRNISDVRIAALEAETVPPRLAVWIGTVMTVVGFGGAVLAVTIG